MDNAHQKNHLVVKSDEIYAMVSFGHKEQEGERNANFFFFTYTGIADAAKLIDPDIRIEWHGPNAWDPIPQVESIRELTERRIDGIMVTAADSTVLNPAIDDAIRAGIPVISFDADAPESQRLSLIATDNYQAGFLAGKTMVEWLEGHGDVAVSTVRNANHLEARLQGFAAALKRYAPYAKIYIAYDSGNIDVDEHGEQDFTEYRESYIRMLQEHPSIKGLFSPYASPGAGAAEAAETLGLRKEVQILAFDFDEVVVKLVERGAIRSTVGQDPYMMGYLAMILSHAARHAPSMPDKHDTAWRVAAIADFLTTHPKIPEAIVQKLRKSLSDLERAKAGENNRIDTGAKILQKETLLKMFSDNYESMRDSIYDKIESLNREIEVRKQAEEELRKLNKELEGRVKRRTAEIARQKYILDSFMANIPDSIYFKDRESRIIRINCALAKRFELENPGDAVGKTDFDFLSAEQAQPKYDQEQEIIRTGKSLFDLEEPNAGGDGWVLTTKMPLRDEHGDIIGTFGISRDITELKQAQRELEDAYIEIQVLNDQLKQENLRMSAELNVARRLQEMVLPGAQELQGLEGVDVVGFMRPADEIGGDYYDVLPQNGRLNIGIGDVTGHGLESGVLMLMTQTAIRTLCEHGETDPVAVVNTLNRTIYKNVQRMGAEKTLTFALIHHQHGQLQLVGQHEEILVVRHSGEIERIDTIGLGFPIGLEQDITQWVMSTTVNLAPGDGIVLYTDGITEAENIQHEFYGIERMCETISRNWPHPPERIKQAVIEDVLRHIGEQAIYDDLTLVIMKQR